MNLYLVKRTGPCDYDEYDAFVIQCKTEQDARHSRPDSDNEDSFEVPIGKFNGTTEKYDSWPIADPDKEGTLEIILLGRAKTEEEKVILASFNAG